MKMNDPLLDALRARDFARVAELLPAAEAQHASALLALLQSPALLQPLLRNRAEADVAMPVLRQVYDVAAAAPRGEDDINTARAAEQLANVYAIHRQSAEAAALLEEALAELSSARGVDPQHVSRVRDMLAIHYRNQNEPAKADALFGKTEVCEHLRPVDQYLRERGARVLSIGTPWSSNCRTWVTFGGVVLDVESLRKRFALPDFVVIHSHRGTHDGAEHGLVCTRHDDALVGVHPELASGLPVIG
jgi:hypothetical protein